MMRRSACIDSDGSDIATVLFPCLDIGQYFLEDKKKVLAIALYTPSGFRRITLVKGVTYRVLRCHIKMEKLLDVQ